MENDSNQRSETRFAEKPPKTVRTIQTPTTRARRRCTMCARRLSTSRACLSATRLRDRLPGVLRCGYPHHGPSRKERADRDRGIQHEYQDEGRHRNLRHAADDSRTAEGGAHDEQHRREPREERPNAAAARLERRAVTVEGQGKRSRDPHEQEREREAVTSVEVRDQRREHDQGGNGAPDHHRKDSPRLGRFLYARRRQYRKDEEGRPMAGTLTWLGHASFRLDSPGGKRIYVDPWLENPKCPDDEKEPERCAAIAVTHGHSDHVGQTVELSNKFGPLPIVAMVELKGWLKNKGAKLDELPGPNKGGTVE